MKKITLAAMLAAVVLVSGCATPLTSSQKREMQFFTQNGYVVEEKSPGAAAGLGLLPGFGSFYVREYGLGIVNLLFWPLSILWDPVSGYDGAQVINYNATKELINRRLKREVKELDEQLMHDQITRDEYIQRKKDVEAKYVYDV